MKGWECPRCGTCHAPHVSSCSCKPMQGIADRLGAPPFPFGPTVAPVPAVLCMQCGAVHIAGPCPTAAPSTPWPTTIYGMTGVDDPPSCPTSLGCVWSGVTQPPPHLHRFYPNRKDVES